MYNYDKMVHVVASAPVAIISDDGTLLMMMMMMRQQRKRYLVIIVFVVVVSLVEEEVTHTHILELVQQNYSLCMHFVCCKSQLYKYRLNIAYG